MNNQPHEARVEDRSIVDMLIISSGSRWKKVFDFLIVMCALFSSYSATYL